MARGPGRRGPEGTGASTGRETRLPTLRRVCGGGRSLLSQRTGTSSTRTLPPAVPREVEEEPADRPGGRAGTREDGGADTTSAEGANGSHVLSDHQKKNFN